MCALTDGPLRFGELARAVPGLSDRLLSRRLRELEDEGLVEREVEAGSPTRVTYSLTDAGQRAGSGDLRDARPGLAAGAASSLAAWSCPVRFRVGPLREDAARRAAQAGARAADRRGHRPAAHAEADLLRAARRRWRGAVRDLAPTSCDRLELPDGALRDGAEFVVAGGPDYYPGGASASPSFSFRVTQLRLAGEGDLLARLEALREQLRAEGLFELQKQLARPAAAEDDRGRHRRVRRRPARPARRSARGAAGRARSSGPSRRSRTGARRRRSPRRSRTSPRDRRSRRSSSPEAAAAWPTSGRSATRPSAARWRCCGCP